MKHPRYDDFEFEQKTYSNGFTYVTCRNLPGFRLWVTPQEDLETAVSEALTVFLPYYERTKLGDDAFNDAVWKSE